MLRDYRAPLKLSPLGSPVVGVYSTATTEDILTKGRNRRSFGMVLIGLKGGRATSLSDAVCWTLIQGSGAGGGEKRKDDVN